MNTFLYRVFFLLLLQHTARKFFYLLKWDANKEMCNHKIACTQHTESTILDQRMFSLFDPSSTTSQRSVGELALLDSTYIVSERTPFPLTLSRVKEAVVILVPAVNLLVIAHV